MLAAPLFGAIVAAPRRCQRRRGWRWSTLLIVVVAVAYATVTLVSVARALVRNPVARSRLPESPGAIAIQTCSCWSRTSAFANMLGAGDARRPCGTVGVLMAFIVRYAPRGGDALAI